MSIGVLFPSVLLGNQVEKLWEVFFGKFATIIQYNSYFPKSPCDLLEFSPAFKGALWAKHVQNIRQLCWSNTLLLAIHTGHWHVISIVSSFLLLCFAYLPFSLKDRTSYRTQMPNASILVRNSNCWELEKHSFCAFHHPFHSRHIQIRI